MKIALINENSQAAKNTMIEGVLRKVVEPMGHEVVNYGKISGAYASCRATKCSPSIQKYLGITLLPQAGVALGMAAEAAELSDGHMVRNVVLFSVLVYELVGPTLAKLSLTAAGEIIPEGRTSARTTNKPEEPVSVK